MSEQVKKGAGQLPYIVLSTFMLGYLNAFSTLSENNSMVGLLTGSFVRWGIMLATRDFSGMDKNTALLLGFCLACVLSAILLKNFKNTNRERLVLWTVFSLPVWVNFFAFSFLTVWQSIFILSFNGGIGLSFFREFGDVDANKNIHTGNMKNFVVALYELIFRKSTSSLGKALKFAALILLFMAGSYGAALAHPHGEAFSLGLISLLSLFPYVFIFKKD